MAVEVYESLRRLTLVNAAWMWSRLYQHVYERGKQLVKEDMYMKYNDVRKLLYLETDASRVGLGATLLQVRDNLNGRHD